MNDGNEFVLGDIDKLIDLSDILSAPIKSYIRSVAEKDGLAPANFREATSPAIGSAFLGASMSLFMGPVGAVLGSLLGYAMGHQYWSVDRDKAYARIALEVGKEVIRDMPAPDRKTVAKLLIEAGDEADRRDLGFADQVSLATVLLRRVDPRASERFVRAVGQRIREFDLESKAE